MANKNNLLSIPLNGELCLNKNKVDITQFAGWNKVNGPIYGGCLSPLYSQQKTYADIWDRAGNNYDITNGVLEKNGTTILNCDARGFKKEKSDLNFDCFDVYVNNGVETIYGINETSTGVFKFTVGNSTVNKTVYSNGTTIKTKVKRTVSGKVFFIVLYATIGGNKYYIYRADTPAEFTGDVSISFRNSGIQVADLDNSNTMFSLFSDFGPDQTDCIKYNLLYNGSNIVADSNISFNCVDSRTSFYSYSKVELGAMITIIRNSVNYYYSAALSRAWSYDINFVYFDLEDDITNSGGTVYTTLTAGTVSDSGFYNTYPMSKKWAIRTSMYNPSTGELETTTQACMFGYASNLQGGTSGNADIINTLYTRTTSTGSFICNVEAINDDGNLYAVTKPVVENEKTNKVKQGGIICVKGTVSSVSGNTINYAASKYIKVEYVAGTTSSIGPQIYDSYSISMGQGGYIRLIYNFTSADGKTAYNCEYDSTFDKLSYCGGVVSGTARSLLGGDSNLNGWRILYNNGYISNLSYYYLESYIGTLLTDWNTIDDTFEIVRLSDRVYYKNTDNEIIKISIISTKDWDYQFIENRYIVLNTVSYYNCYDTKLNIKLHWASDYNNRVNLGNAGIVFNIIPDYKTVLVASSQNGNYEATKKSVASVQYGAVVYENVVPGYEEFADCEAPESDELSRINFYCSDGAESTGAIYDTSFLNGVYFNAPAMIDLVYPVASSGNMLYNPTIFTKFISTYNNKDMVISDGTTYSLVYSGTTPIMLFSMLSGIEEIESLFVLQTQYYGISGNKIFTMSFSDGVVALSDVAANITGMKFLGALPTRALFYSPMNRCIYSFGGDAILQLNIESNEITEVYGTWYNTATQALYLGTNNGLYIISDTFIYKLDFNEVENIYFTDSGNSILNLANKSVFLSYNKSANNAPIELDLETKYFGLGNNQPCNIDCWYIKLYNNDVKEGGKVTLQCSTITDKGTVNEKKEFQILPNSWDKNDDYIYLRYQPSVQKGIGCKLMLKTKFPIIDIAVGYTAFDGAAQVSHANI